MSSDSNRPFHLVSWNVAGLTTTVTTLAAIRPKEPFTAFLDRWPHVSVFCLQEAKVTEKKLADDPFACGAAARGGDTGQWESFWAHASKAHRGMNGVATFARQGLVHHADAAPLRQPELDAEGRCIAVYLSSLIIFNVYIPNGRGGSRVAFRSQYVDALRVAMKRVRAETGLPVVLAGDLNMVYRPVDTHWSIRRVDVTHLAAANGPEVDAFLAPPDRTRLLNQILAWMRWERLPPHVTAGTPEAARHVGDAAVATRSRYEEAKVSDSSPSANSMAAGSDEINDAQRHQSLTSQPSESGALPTHPDRVWIETFLPKPSNPSAECNEPWYRVACLAGLPSHGPEAAESMRSLLIDDEFTDSYVECWPAAVSRFSCFNQFTNSRYSNIGSRIDYILLPPELKTALRRGVDRLPFDENSNGEEGGWSDVPLVGGSSRLNGDEFWGEAHVSALRAVTHSGVFQPAPFDKSGLEPLNATACDLQFAAFPAHTGIVATAPQLSDHLAISALLDLAAVGRAPVPRDLTVPWDATTKACMYRRQQRSIRDFFGAATAPQKTTPIAAAEDRHDAAAKLRLPERQPSFSEPPARRPPKAEMPRPVEVEVVSD
jgi:exonuclease III